MVTVNVTDSTISASVSSTGDVSVVAPTAASGIVAIGSAFQPASHAATHGATGSDPVSLSGSQMQINCGVTDIYSEDDSVTTALQAVEQYINTTKTAAANAANITAGTLSSARLPVATTTAVGVVAVGSGLSMVGGTALRANVLSVNGRTGAVSLSAADVSAADGDHTHGPISSTGLVNGELQFLGDDDSSGAINGGVAYLSSIVFANLTSQNTAFTGSAANITSGTLSVDRLPVVQDKSSSLGSTGASLTLSLASTSVQRATLSENCTFTMPTAVAGASLTLILTQGGTGFTASFTSVKWPGGSAPTVTATSGKVDVLRFVSDGTHWYGSIHQNY